ncbi:hypothetical protein V6N12_035118 [Hibiscus sabdariffa]|uniref:Ribulose-phosphate 3-epimerase n=1 Tax=Hibiscus sabdariffa TaxID=183260 RepID=A0ABR1Z8E6_9ROSI
MNMELDKEFDALPFGVDYGKLEKASFTMLNAILSTEHELLLLSKSDGGLGPSTIDMAASAAANCIVTGSSVFGAPEPAVFEKVFRKISRNVKTFLRMQE